MSNLNKSLGKNTFLISQNELNNISDTNLIGVDNFKKIFETTRFSFSSTLLNYIESEIINGVEKTVFYSEVNTELEKGDRVFILNGNYDSNAYIEQNKYELNSDGYEVLDVDRCRITLNIKYDGNKLPYNQESDHIINVYYVADINELNSITDILSDDIVYYEGELGGNFNNISTGLTYSSPTASGFNYLNGLTYTNINTDFDNGSGIFVNKKIKIINYNFLEYKRDFVYKYFNGKWIPSIENLVPIITKSNFRGGKIDSGSWNSGVYGRPDKILEWDGGSSAKWGGGFFYNSNWIGGEFNSLDTNISSFICRLENGLPIQESIEINNNGYGYNYILNSDIKGGTINNGNIIKTNFTNNINTNVVKEYIETNTVPTIGTIKVNGGLFLKSDIADSFLSGSKLVNTKLKNTLFKNGVSVNSQITSSVFNNSVYITDDVIKVIEIKTKDIDDKVTYEFTIPEFLSDRLRLGDFFYIKGIVDNKKDTNLISFFHRKFKLSSWVERFEYIQGINISTKDIKVTAFLSNSILKIIFEKDDSIVFPIINTTDTTNIFILDSNYESGLFESSDWNSGFNINNGNTISDTINGSGKYNLSVQNTNQIRLDGPDSIYNNEIIFLNSVEHTDNLGRKTILGDSYSSINNNVLEEISTDILSTLSTTEYIRTGDGYNRNGYVHRLKFKDSKINSGIFKRTYFNNCLIQNKFYKSTDRDLSDIRNIRSLLINESIFYKTNNTLSSATYLNCLFEGKQDVLIDGIVHNSIWNGGTFNKGVFRESTWIDGEFNGGDFYKNNSFDGKPTKEKPLLTDNRITSFYKSGNVLQNNRYSWQGGKFNGGNFIKSDWENGDFNGGVFMESKFYNGNINGGVIGKKSLDYTRTRIYNGIINNTRVENAHLFATDYEYSGSKIRNITWNNGVFESGVFGSRNNKKEYFYKIDSSDFKKSEDVDYVYVSDNNNIYRIDIDDPDGFKIKIKQPKVGVGTSIKIIADSIGNMFDIRSNSITKYSKNGGVYKLSNGTYWKIDYSVFIVRDVLIDEFDNLYVCLSNRIDKYDSNKRLVWSINNNTSNTSIGYDGEFIYVGGTTLSGNNGYLEKWSLEGELKWRRDGLLFSVTNVSQKIIIVGNFVFINGNLSDKHIIFKIDKISGERISTYEKPVGIVSDYTYINLTNELIMTTSTGFSKFNISNDDDTIDIPYTSLSISGCQGLEYYNGYIYIYSFTGIFKSDINLSLISSNTISISGIVKLHIRPNGMRYSRLELISPKNSNGDLVSGDNNFTLRDSNSYELNMTGIEFDVNKISFNYSISKDIITNDTTPEIPTELPEFAIYINNELVSSTQSITIGTYSITNDSNQSKWIYANDWEYYKYNISGTSSFNTYTLRFDKAIQHTIKINQLVIESKESEMVATWKDGIFNGGEFIEGGVWENGIFNNGLFLSTHGNEFITGTQSPTQSNQFGWINGKFNGGEFGNGEIENNSLWYNGEFNGGVFKGKLWNNGIFTNGKFQGDINVPILGTDNTKSYLTSIFIKDTNNIDLTTTKGIWKDGYVSVEKDRHIKDKKIFTDLKKVSDDIRKVEFENVVWSGGTFSHENGNMSGSIWLDGTFESGIFENSVFNPWRHNNTFNENLSCIWKNGLFKGGDFYYSNWKGGLFNTGNAYGMIWEDGISNYMNAYNILWKGGVWKNGNWFGSNFKYDITIINDIFRTTILDRISKDRHYWNLMDNSSSSSKEISSGTASSDIQ